MVALLVMRHLGLMYTLQGLHELGEDVSPVLARYGLDREKLDPAGRC